MQDSVQSKRFKRILHDIDRYRGWPNHGARNGPLLEELLASSENVVCTLYRNLKIVPVQVFVAGVDTLRVFYMQFTLDISEINSRFFGSQTVQVSITQCHHTIHACNLQELSDYVQEKFL